MVVKKSIVFDSKEEHKLFENILGTRASAYKTTQSTELYELVTKSLPKNKDARDFCIQLYNGENIISVLEDIFGLYAASVPNVNYKGEELIIFLKKFSKNLDYYNVDNQGEKVHFVNMFSMVIDILRRKNPPSKGADVGNNSVLFASFICDEAKNEPQYFKVLNFISCIQKNWDYIGDNTYVYRTLSSICRIVKEQGSTDAADRIELIELITRIAVDWE